MNLDEKFTRIIEDALVIAAEVDCSMADYRSALRDWIDHINTVIDASESSE